MYKGVYPLGRNRGEGVLWALFWLRRRASINNVLNY